MGDGDMLGSNQRKFALGLAENGPTIVFLGTLQLTGELRTAGSLADSSRGEVAG